MTARKTAVAGPMPRAMQRRSVLLGGAALAAASAWIPTMVMAQDVLGAAPIRGAGSTFAFPLVSAWAHDFQRFQARGTYAPGGGLDSAPPGAALEYEPVGSLAGMLRLRANAVDFAASDVPLSSGELQKLGLRQFPIAIGGVVLVVNIEGVPSGALRLSGPVLAQVLSGKIRRWADPALQALNPSLKLPDEDIRVIHRAEGSGTTWNLTHYLSKVSPEWKTGIGTDLLVKWPVGSGVRSNSGLAKSVKSTRNAIGYVSYAQALEDRLNIAQLQNSAGQFIVPEVKTFQTAAALADWAGSKDFSLVLNDVAAPGAYPIVASVFVLLAKDHPPARTSAIFNLLQWSLDNGAEQATRLGYVPLPPSLIGLVKASWKANFQAAVREG